MEILNKKMLAFILIVAFAILMPFGNVKAALQANPNTHYKKRDTPMSWMPQIRNMEKNGEAMGLNETLNSDLTASSASNGIDVHMMRSTEYGAIAILSASGYGNSTTLQNSSIKTTTGNKTGVYFNGTDWEYVAGGYTWNIFPGVNSKYYDAYNTTNNSSAKVGDALGSNSTTNPGCARWHSATRSYWVESSNGSGRYFGRGLGGLFSFSYENNNDSNRTNYPGPSEYGRGVAVVGAGLLYRVKYIIIFRIRGENFKEFSEYLFIYKRDVIPS